ncbi:hypothetical protein JTB14_002801 [Gonioctena quinquepunctata]|nr:hypothetical protein JTB14_002801 [Gonioctena quinquepunctata]
MSHSYSISRPVTPGHSYSTRSTSDTRTLILQPTSTTSTSHTGTLVYHPTRKFHPKTLNSREVSSIGEDSIAFEKNAGRRGMVSRIRMISMRKQNSTRGYFNSRFGWNVRQGRGWSSGRYDPQIICKRFWG